MYAYHICSLHTSQVALQVGAYPGFCSMKQLRVFLFPPPPFLDGMLVNRRVTPNIKFTGTHLYTWVERVTMRAHVKYRAQEPNPQAE